MSFVDMVDNTGFDSHQTFSSVVFNTIKQIMIASALKLCLNSHTVQLCTKNVQRSHATLHKTMHETCKCDTATSCQLVFCKINLEPASRSDDEALRVQSLSKRSSRRSSLGRNWTSCFAPVIR